MAREFTDKPCRQLGATASCEEHDRKLVECAELRLKQLKSVRSELRTALHDCAELAMLRDTLMAQVRSLEAKLKVQHEDLWNQINVFKDHNLELYGENCVALDALEEVRKKFPDSGKPDTFDAAIRVIVDQGLSHDGPSRQISLALREVAKAAADLQENSSEGMGWKEKSEALNAALKRLAAAGCSDFTEKEG